MISIFDSVTNLKRIGPAIASRLERLNIATIQDVIFHLPIRYQDRTRLVPIGSIRPGDAVLIEGKIDHSETVFRRRRALVCRMSDGTGAINLRFFHFNKQQQENLSRGTRIRCYGEARINAKHLEMIHPEYKRVFSEQNEVDKCLTPIYPATEGLQQKILRQLSDQALLILYDSDALSEWVPQDALAKFNYPTLKESLIYIHRPPPDASLSCLSEGRHIAQQRLAFEELLAHHLSMLQMREKLQQNTAPEINASGSLQADFTSLLDFKLTNAQLKVIQEINQDFKKPYPALRLVQGDVGSGKTVIAALAALQVIEAGYQVAIMAPTELLAEQHYKNFLAWFNPLKLQVGWLSGKMRSRERKTMSEALQDGTVNIVIGTHALFQEKIEFHNLALMIIDEQHRFGVHQRLALHKKGVNGNQCPHQITMTATPIPRTLAMAAYADLDHSVIDELPSGRKPVKTVALSEARRAEVIKRIEKACLRGQQAYWVCTLIEESEAIQCQAAEDTATLLEELLPNINIGLVHGRMKADEKESIMKAFKLGDINLLVATTVIEVGVDVPNASLIIIENAERLGLIQLHQLRGRVGRGNTESVCVLIYRAPLTQRAKQRLEIMRNYNDGFEIANKDLEMRGPGEIFGIRQTGLIDFRVAEISRDAHLLPDVKNTAKLMLKEYPQQVEPLIHRWLGNKRQFKQV